MGFRLERPGALGQRRPLYFGTLDPQGLRSLPQTGLLRGSAWRRAAPPRGSKKPILKASGSKTIEGMVLEPESSNFGYVDALGLQLWKQGQDFILRDLRLCQSPILPTSANDNI